ncbi:MAG: MBL fold metallo-hydrolase [Burkholderiales bacterium]|jgi:glyoxylase-like metal-dependent hydrolase (beta-lactamase superfamily II)
MNPDAPSATFGPVTVFFGEKNGKYPDGNQVVVRGADTLAVFDTPQVAQRIGDAFDAADLAILGHVHEDHMAGLRRIPRAAVHVHEADVDAARSWAGLSRHYGYPESVLGPLRAKIERDFDYAPRPDAIAYADGARWELGGGVSVSAIHMPGHTAGHSVLLVEPEGVAFIGDIDLSGFGPYYGDATSDLGAFRRTLRRVAEIPARTWVTSHHKGVYTERAAFETALRAFEATLGAREAKLLGMIGDGARTLDELVAMRLLYPEGYEEVWIDCAERRTIGQHLDELLAAGRVRVEDGRWRAA